MVRNSLTGFFLALTRPDCPQVADMWPCRKAVMYEFFPLIVLQHQQTALLAPWGCVVQDMFNYTLAVSNAEAILHFLFFFYVMVYTIDKHAYVHLIFFCFSVMCSNKYNFLKYSCAATTDVFSGGTGMLLWGVISDSVSAGFGYFLMYILKRPLRGDPQLARQETNADKQLKLTTVFTGLCQIQLNTYCDLLIPAMLSYSGLLFSLHTFISSNANLDCSTFFFFFFTYAFEYGNKID